MRDTLKAAAGSFGAALLVALLLSLVGCVDGSPVEAQAPVEPEVALALVTAEGDSLQIFKDGTYKARPSGYWSVKFGGGGFSEVTIPMWAVGEWRREGGQLCARPNYFKRH